MYKGKSKIRMLVVDDTEANRYGVARVLTKAGYEVIEAACGKDAIRLAAEQPDLIILDIHLPDMLGFDVCRTIKADPNLRSIPILHLSASYIHPDDKATGLDSGADGYLAQPVEPLELLATIRSLLRMREVEQELKTLNEILEQRIVERTLLAESRAEQVKLMAASLSRVEQSERRKIATELHDNLAQLLVVCKMRLSLIRGVSDAHQAHIEKLDDFLGQAMDYTRSFITELSPMVLHDGGIAAGLTLLIPRMAKNGLNVTIQSQDKQPKLSEELLIIGFQATRELLFNVLKHSNVSDANVVITSDTKHVYIEVIDKGKGFDVAALGPYPKEKSGFGLFSIRERLALLGGSLVLESVTGEGTRATITLPISHGPNDHVEMLPAQAGEKMMTRQDESQIRVMIVDDHEIMRDGLRRILAECTDMEIVAEANNGLEAIEKARSMTPDVVLMDISMPVMNGVEATRHIASENPQISVIGLSVHNDQAISEAIRRAGAKAYLSKDSPRDILLGTIRQLSMAKTT